MNETRRGFLGLLAKVPFLAGLSAWMARPVEAKEVVYRKPGLWLCLFEDKGILRTGSHTDYLCEHPTIGDYRIIRWIPVTERLPEVNAADSGTSCMYSRHVLTASASGTIEFSRLANLTRNVWWRCGRPLYVEYCRNDVTHWAELPEPPTCDTATHI